MRKTLPERFWEKVDKSGVCWRWTAATHHEWGYGHFTVGGKNKGAHRVSWELHFGPIPDGIRVLHRCDNPPCVNPAHLFLGTDGDNVADMIAKGRDRHRHNVAKTHCPSGHAYDPANTRTYRNAAGWTMRFCKECARGVCRENYAKNRVKRIAMAVEYAHAQRSADPDGFRRLQRDYMRACRARKREAAAHQPVPPTT